MKYILSLKDFIIYFWPNFMIQKVVPFVLSVYLIVFVTLGYGQTIPATSDGLRAMAVPNVEHVCTLDHTDINANMFIRPAIDVQRLMKSSNFVNFEVDYKVTENNSCGNSSWPNDALAAFQLAMDIWSVHLDSDIPIKIEANWIELEERTLGSAGPTQIVRLNDIGIPNTWYNIAQLSAMSGRVLRDEIDGVEYDIRVNMNCDFDNWYFGTDANPAQGTIDLTTVVLHEIAHGIGFFGSFSVEEGEMTGRWGQGEEVLRPFSYDRFVEDADGNDVLDESVYPNPSGAIWEALTGRREGLFFTGTDAVTSLAGTETPDAKLYTPEEFAQGSSYSHVDQETFSFTPNALMRPRIDRALAVHSPGPLLCGILSDMGWPMGSGCLSFLAADAIVSVSENELNFGVINQGETETLTLIIANDITATEELEGSISSNDEHFIIEGIGSFSILPGQTISVDVRFMPQDDGRQQAKLTLIHNARNTRSPIEIPVEGEALRENRIVKLEQSYPNPTVGPADQPRIPYAISDDLDVSLKVYSMDGRLVRDLVNARQNSGRYEVDVDMRGLSGGIYIYRIVAGGNSESGKLMHVN